MNKNVLIIVGFVFMVYLGIGLWYLNRPPQQYKVYFFDGSTMVITAQRPRLSESCLRYGNKPTETVCGVKYFLKLEHTK